ncbi:site-specific integrase [Luteibacter sahnii]|uniref:site-specific integrase n=1 Tax=Luteibacter sahnii TaxID=3021977 RepID=UPI002A69DEAA|nr:integrase [Luteibacter sp. PPL193]MDY1547868.1 integrase [Luteibacter sp. PPL193]
MKRMGRPRLIDKTIPAHIDQSSIPKGAYWSRTDRHWFTVLVEDGKRKRRKLAGPEVRLSDLHRILEEFAGVERGTLLWLCELFHETSKFKALAAKTREDYEAQLKIVRTYQTKRGPLGSLRVVDLTTPFVQRLVDKIGGEHPSKANHLLRYLRRVLNWGVTRGHCGKNPAAGVEQAVERRQRRLPAEVAFAAVRAEAQAHFPHYVWIALELAFLLRLRGIEAITLTDAHASDEGVQTNRRKGSRDTLILWSPRLRAAWDEAIRQRNAIWAKRRMPVPMQAIDRLVLVNVHGKPVTRRALSTIWQTLMKHCIEKGAIAPEQRFGMHDAKRKGITDTKGTRAEKRESSGHKSDAMMDVYDLSLPRTTTPGGV